jgi:hypothetical protein
MTTYALGDGVPIEYRAYVDGEPVDVTAALALFDPAGDETAAAPIEHVDTGFYRYVMPTGDPNTDLGPWVFAWTISGALTDVEFGSFYVALAGAPVYGGLDKLKRRRKIPVDDTTDDDLLLDDLETASRMVELKTGGRQFWLSPEPVALTYSWRRNVCYDRSTRRHVLATQDFASTVGLVVEYDATFGRGAPQWTTIAPSTYEAFREDGEGPETPYTGIAFFSWVSLPFIGCPRIRVTSRPGWPAVPAVVDRSTLILATRYSSRDGSPEGVIQSQEWGGARVARFDPDVEAMLANLTRPEFA